MRIATSPINWNNEDVPLYRPWVPYPQILDEIKQAGYTATEWSRSLPEDVERLKRDLAGYGLTMVGAFVGLELRNPEKREAEIARALEKAAFLQALGARHLVVADAGDDTRRAVAGHAGPEHFLSEEGWKSLTTGLNALGEELQAMGIELVFHNHVGTYVETGPEIVRLLEETDPRLVGWCLDTGHLVYGGGDLMALLKRYATRVRYLHLKDVDPEVLGQAKARSWGFDEALKRYIFAPLGRGMVPLRESILQLKAAGFEGWVVIEQDTTPTDPTKTARENRLWLQSLLKEVSGGA